MTGKSGWFGQVEAAIKRWWVIRMDGVMKEDSRDYGCSAEGSWFCLMGPWGAACCLLSQGGR